jgi:hypothetical protein
MLLALFLQQAFTHSPTPDYERLVVRGHPVYVSPAAKGHPETKEALAHLEADLKDIEKWVPRDARRRIESVPFWIEWENPENVGACFHPSRKWLKEHGYNTDKTQCVEIGNVKNYLAWTKIQPCMVLHELSHAYMNLVIGDDNPSVLAAYKSAMDAKVYESVAYHNGKQRKAYAATNAKEYFAELSEAYFGKNDFYPFNRQELKTADPKGYAAVEQAWTKGERR